eukprot:m.233623 g.233623  ORF g.233623 m.233623 type:complete len:762 (+) comp12544_c0_seq1:40-2325(+)
MDETSVKRLIGKKVEVDGLGLGVLMYFGPVEGKGKLCGVALMEPKGDSDGAYEGQRCFECSPGHGVFVSADKIAPADAPRPAESNENSKPNSVEKAEADPAIVERLKKLKDLLGVAGAADVNEQTPEDILAMIEARLAGQSAPAEVADTAAPVPAPAPVATPVENNTTEAEGQTAKKQPPAVAPKRRSTIDPAAGITAPGAAAAAPVAEASAAPATMPKPAAEPAKAAPPATKPKGNKEKATMCPGCSIAVTDGVTVESGIKYHEKCVVCATCTKPLVGGSINEIAGKLYCSVHAFEAKANAPAPAATTSREPSVGDLKSKLAAFQKDESAPSPRASQSEESKATAVSGTISKLEGGDAACNAFVPHAFKKEKCANCQKSLEAHESKAAQTPAKRSGSVRNIVTKHEASSRGVVMPEGAPTDALPSMSIRDRTSSLMSATKPAKSATASATPGRRASLTSKSPSAKSSSAPSPSGSGSLSERLASLEANASKPVPTTDVSSELKRSGSVRGSVKNIFEGKPETKDEDKPKTVDAPSMSLRDRLASLSGERPKPFEEEAAKRAESVAPAKTAPRISLSGKADAATSNPTVVQEPAPTAGASVAIESIPEESVVDDNVEATPEAEAEAAEAEAAESAEPAEPATASEEAVPEADEEEPAEEDAEMAALRAQIAALKQGGSSEVASEPVLAPADEPIASEPALEQTPVAASAPSKAEVDFYGSDDDDDDAGDAAAAAPNPFNPFNTAAAPAPASAEKAVFNPFA